jgi:hypothetical protein
MATKTEAEGTPNAPVKEAESDEGTESLRYLTPAEVRQEFAHVYMAVDARRKTEPAAHPPEATTPSADKPTVQPQRPGQRPLHRPMPPESMRKRALALGRELAGLEGVRANIELEKKLRASTTEADAKPLLLEAKRRGWPEGGYWALPKDHPIGPNGGSVYEAVLEAESGPIIERAKKATSGRAAGARKTNRTRAESEAESKRRRRVRRKVVSLIEDGQRDRAIVRILHEQGEEIARDTVATIRKSPKARG